MVSIVFFGVLTLQLFPMVSPSFSRSLAIFARRLSSSCRSRLTLATFSAEFAEPGERKYGRNGKRGWWWSLLLLLVVVVVLALVLVLLWLLSLLNTSTSSAAQGGGGSFKNKPVGEVGCLWIKDGRANPLMDRKVVGVVFFGAVAMVAVVTWSVASPTTAGCSVV